MYSDDRYYSQEHEWVEPQEEGDYVLGITHFAQEELGDVVFVELPEVGAQFDSESEIGTIESVKAVAELYAPMAGEITAVNEEVLDSPELLNDDPHGQGWLVRMRPEDPKAHEDLMTSDEYCEFIGYTDGDEIEAVDADDLEDDDAGMDDNAGMDDD